MDKTNLAPIVLFTYNRPWHTQQVLDALRKNELSGESELFVFSDGAANAKDEKLVNETREKLRAIEGFKKVTVFERPVNFGLAANIIGGVTTVIEEYGKVII